MAKVEIKNIPPDEEYLLAIKTNYFYKHLFLPQQQKIKFIITNKGIYYKISGVLIDTTGTVFLPFNEIFKAERGKYLYYSKLIFTGKNGSTMTIVDKAKIISAIIDILKKQNINIVE